MRTDLAVGMVLRGRYRVQGEVGRGATSVVYAALDIATRVPVAVKVVQRQAAANPAAIERLLAEARVLARTRDPNVVHVGDYGFLEDGRPFMVMEFLAGCTLHELLEREPPLDWKRARPLLLSACAALESVHEAGIVHRDVKPQNLFLQDDDRTPNIKVLGFGLARDPHACTDEGVALECSNYALLGTPGFMAPEQVTSADVDQRADVYALGVTMFVMLTGRLPFVSDHPVKQMAQHLYLDPPRPRSLAPSIPAAVEHLMLRTLAKDPAQRTPSMRALRWELERVTVEDAAYPPLLELRQIFDVAHGQQTVDLDDELDDTELSDATPHPIVDDDPTPLALASTSPPEPSERPSRTGLRLGFAMLGVGLFGCVFAMTPLGSALPELVRDAPALVPDVRASSLEDDATPAWRPTAPAVVPDAKRDATVIPTSIAEPVAEPTRAPARPARRRAPTRFVASPATPTSDAAAPADPVPGDTPMADVEEEEEVEATPPTEAAVVDAPLADANAADPEPTAESEAPAPQDPIADEPPT